MEKQQVTINEYVAVKINLLQKREESYTRATLAKLRRGVGRHPGNVPDIWDFTLSDMPEDWSSQSGEPTPYEWAAHMAITLFALHQQGKDIKQNPMSVRGGSLGSAVRLFINKRGMESENAIKRRFDTVITANAAEELSFHLRGLINLIKSESIPLDYPRLAEDLHKFQYPEQRDKIRLRWGQDYYFNKNREVENNDEE